MEHPVCRPAPAPVPLRHLGAARMARRAVVSPHGIVRVVALVGISGRWLFPWACTFALSATIVCAAGQAFARLPVGQAVLNQSAAEPPQHSPGATGFRWVVLSSKDAQGASMSLTCLTAANEVAADVLDIRPPDLDGVAGALCTPSSFDRAAVARTL
jgi:hypothetical protein